jgi:hypothetical protein
MHTLKTSALVLTLMLIVSVHPCASAAETELEIQSVNARQTQVEGSRGAALAVGSNGTLYLGGGERGDTLFAYQGGNISPLGTISTQGERLRDSRFGPTDVAILKETSAEVHLLISYPQLDAEKRCVRLVASQSGRSNMQPAASK